MAGSRRRGATYFTLNLRCCGAGAARVGRRSLRVLCGAVCGEGVPPFHGEGVGDADGWGCRTRHERGAAGDATLQTSPPVGVADTLPMKGRDALTADRTVKHPQTTAPTPRRRRARHTSPRCPTSSMPHVYPALESLAIVSLLPVFHVKHRSRHLLPRPQRRGRGTAKRWRGRCRNPEGLPTRPEPVQAEPVTRGQPCASTSPSWPRRSRSSRPPP